MNFKSYFIILSIVIIGLGIVFTQYKNDYSKENKYTKLFPALYNSIDQVSKIAKAITPVPGGVGPMTIACLLSNTVECFRKAQS